MVLPVALTRHFQQGSLSNLCPELRYDQGAKVREFVSGSTWYETAAGAVTFQPAVDTELGTSIIKAAARAKPGMKVGRMFARIQDDSRPMRFHQDRNSWPSRFVGASPAARSSAGWNSRKLASTLKFTDSISPLVIGTLGTMP